MILNVIHHTCTIILYSMIKKTCEKTRHSCHDTLLSDLKNVKKIFFVLLQYFITHFEHGALN